MTHNSKYDVIVIGAGHAGAEAAHAAARLGARTALVTMSRDTIAKMSCNPAIGGIGKGQLVREIDALGGLMARAIDATGIQFRILNRSKGPAVQSPRAQADKYAYKDWIRRALEAADNLTIIEGAAAEILTDGSRVSGVQLLDGRTLAAGAVIVTAGTFLAGTLHCGPDTWPGGRLDEPASTHLASSLRKLGLTVGRLKTGTPVRLAGDTIDYGACEEQPGDPDPRPFSFMTDRLTQPQIPCWITYTNPDVHKLLLDNLDRAPLYSGRITSAGPRYCPSIETKILRFADKDRHQVFLEPEDRDRQTIYCNGISTSVPKDIQRRMLELIPATRSARIVHWAYAIEYDYYPATQLKVTLETRAVPGLYLAGQINGTTGYEEAGALGLMAGLNAVRTLEGKDPVVLTRDRAYIGVMLDDLLTREIDEPYRMFTSRAEYRLTLRSDNADRRLTPLAKDLGLIDNERWTRYTKKMEQIEELKIYLRTARSEGKSLWDLLKQPDREYGLKELDFPEEVLEAASIEAKYEGYLARQQREIDKFRNLENIKLPEGLDYSAVPHLRYEAKEKLARLRPYTLGQASRIGGITPADIAVIQIHLKKKSLGK
jgi:tRNA uridine 5-carboxymethylaminomethyl modification enzyme